ncbi:MAG TPA: hypothetical protein VFC71_10025 [Candidatus Polarisedimenticolia bacterium]|nr:hypothetical protein [Candidatus Polarisedimenticolia bacterium]
MATQRDSSTVVVSDTGGRDNGTNIALAVIAVIAVIVLLWWIAFGPGNSGGGDNGGGGGGANPSLTIPSNPLPSAPASS